MRLFKPDENRVRCGKCGSEFDFNKNTGCPFCGFGSKTGTNTTPDIKSATKGLVINYLTIPKELKLKPGQPEKNDETKTVGSWGMFNSFFPGKAVLRILGNLQSESNQNSVPVSVLMEKTAEQIKVHGLSHFRGFPNDPDRENSIGRLYHHFIKTFCNMGLISLKLKEDNGNSVWDEDWQNVEISLTKEGLEFAQLKNLILDDGQESQILSPDEKKWLLSYLIHLDKKDYKEYSMLKQVYEFIKEGHNGNEDLWAWFRSNPVFISYVKKWSRKADDDTAFKKQLENLAPTFAASKVALLRELGVIKNKRNDYTIIGGI
jgi:ribosomal protein L37E